jgi:hypothetical protein
MPPAPGNLVNLTRPCLSPSHSTVTVKQASARKQHQVLRGSFNGSQCMLQVTALHCQHAGLYEAGLTRNRRGRSRRITANAGCRTSRAGRRSARNMLPPWRLLRTAATVLSTVRPRMPAYAADVCRENAMHLAASLGRERFGGTPRLRTALPRRGPVCHADTQRDPATRTVAASAAVRPRAAGTDVSGRPKRAGSPQCGWATAHAPRADVVVGARALVGLRRVHRSLDPRLGALQPMRHGIPCATVSHECASQPHRPVGALRRHRRAAVLCRTACVHLTAHARAAHSARACSVRTRCMRWRVAACACASMPPPP